MSLGLCRVVLWATILSKLWHWALYCFKEQLYKTNPVYLDCSGDRFYLRRHPEKRCSRHLIWTANDEDLSASFDSLDASCSVLLALLCHISTQQPSHFLAAHSCLRCTVNNVDKDASENDFHASPDWFNVTSVFQMILEAYLNRWRLKLSCLYAH